MLDGDDNVMQQAETESCFCQLSISSHENSYATCTAQSRGLIDNNFQPQNDPGILEQNHDPGQSHRHDLGPTVLTNNEPPISNTHPLAAWHSNDHSLTSSQWLSLNQSDLTDSPSTPVSNSNQLIFNPPNPINLFNVFDSNPTSSASIAPSLSNSWDFTAQDPLTGNSATFECDSCSKTFHHKYERRCVYSYLS
jgi:hypothetical protein